MKATTTPQHEAAWIGSHIRQIDRVFSRNIRSRRRPVRSTWCHENIRLPSEISASPGAYSFAGREYLREIIDAVDDHETHEIVLVAGTQIGKTTLVQAIIASQGEVDSAPMMLAGPDQVYAREQREAIYKTCDASPTLRNKVPPERLRNDRWIDLGGCRIYLAWSGSTQRLSGRSCKIVLCSEVDRWVSSVNLARQRTKAFWRSCVVYEGAPIGASLTLYPLWEKSDKRTLHVPCSRCGHYQELRFFPHSEGERQGCGGVGGLRDENGDYRTAAEARKHAYYICEKGCRIEASEKTAMVSRGVWCPEGCQVVDGKVTGTPKYAGRRRGYRLNSLASAMISLGDAAEEWISVRDSEIGKRSFFNDWLAMKYESRGKTPKWTTLGPRIRGRYRRGYVPPEVVFLTCGADVQMKELYWTVRGWGESQTSWLIDWGVFEHREGQRDQAFCRLTDEVYDKDWPVAGVNGLGQGLLRVIKAGIDSNYDTMDLHNFVSGLGRPYVHTVQGEPSLKAHEPYRFSLVEKNQRSGKAYRGGMRLWQINTAMYKADIQGRWQMDLGMPGFWHSTSASNEEAELYLRQLSNEARVIEVSQKTGRPREVWKVLDRNLRSDFLDTEVYSAAMADLVVDRNWENLTSRFREAMELLPSDSPQQHPDDNESGGFIRKPETGFLGAR